MARRDYPYRKRDTDQMGKFMANIITLPFLLVSDFMKTSTISNNYSDSNINTEPKELNPKFFLIKYFILGILSLLCPIISSWSFIEFGIWLWISVPITGLVQLILDFLLLSSEENYLFDKFRLRKQINAVKIINLWTIFVFTIQLIFNLLILIAIIKYDKILYSNNLEYLISELKTYDVSVVCVCLGLIINFIGFLLSVFFYKNLYKRISVDDSYKNAIDKVSRINVKILFELYKPNNIGSKLELDNGSSIESINNLDWTKCGFIFTKKNGNKKKYNLNKYAPSLIDYVKDGQRLFKEIAEDINKDLSIYDVESIV